MMEEHKTNLVINTLTQEQYDAALSAGTLDPFQLYLTPMDDVSAFVTKQYVDQKTAEAKAYADGKLSDYYTSDETDAKIEQAIGSVMTEEF